MDIDFIDYKDWQEELLIDFKNKIDWEKIIRYRKLSENSLAQVIDSPLFNHACWHLLTCNYPLSEEFIIKFQNELDKRDRYWGNISQYQNLSYEFIEKKFRKIWWKYVLTYQELTSEFVLKYKHREVFQLKMRREIYEFNKSHYFTNHETSDLFKITDSVLFMLPYQKNEYLKGVLDKMSEEEKDKYLKNSWLYKSTEFRKEQILNLNLFECYEDYFITEIMVDKNKFAPATDTYWGGMNFHHQFLKGKTLSIFANQTNEDEHGNKGFYVGTYQNLCMINADFDDNFSLIKVKVKYENVVHITPRELDGFFSFALRRKFNERNNTYIEIRCNELTVLE